MPRAKKEKKPKAISSTQSLGAFVKGICDVMRRSNCASALQYVPELTWILFLRILDAQEVRDQDNAEAVGVSFTPALRAPYRWQDWAAPYSDKPGHPKTPEGRLVGWKRQELFAAGDGKLFDFINKELLPNLHSLDIDPRTNLPDPSATPKQRVIGRIMTAVERVRVDFETNLRDILDRVDKINIDHIDDKHFFTLSQVYEDLLLKMGEKNSDGGQFFTPREVIRAMVHTVDPQLGRDRLRPRLRHRRLSGHAYEHMARKLGAPGAQHGHRHAQARHLLRPREGEPGLPDRAGQPGPARHRPAQPLARQHADAPRHLWRAIRQGARSTFDVILTNPPFGGKEGKDAQKNFAFKTSATQVLFLQHVLAELAPGGTLRHRAGRGSAVPHQRDRLCRDQAQAAGRMRTLGHRQPAGRRVLRRGRGRENQSGVLHQGPQRPSASGTTTCRT